MMTAEQVMQNAEQNGNLEPCTVYCVHPEATRKQLERVCVCDHDGDARSIARFFRDRDEVYTFAYTDDECKWTVLESRTESR